MIQPTSIFFFSDFCSMSCSWPSIRWLAKGGMGQSMMEQQMQLDGHFPADEFEPFVHIVFGFSLFLFD
jgi:hypothetical protein